MPSIFDSILILKGIPAMPTMIASNRSRWPVTAGLQPELMEFVVPRAVTEAELERLFSLIEEAEKNGKEVPNVLPIVERTPDGELLVCGAVKCSHLRVVQQALEASRPRPFQL